MKSLLTEFFVCPMCLPEQNGLISRVTEKDGEDIESGSLRCRSCGETYPIQDGIAFLFPRRSGPSNCAAASQYEASALASSYLWSHYADLFEDPDACTAYREWAELLEDNGGLGVDAGCAVGRFTFEMSNKSDFVVGIDISNSFIRMARNLMKHRRISFQIPREGKVVEEIKIKLKKSWDSNSIEFILADVQALPFRTGLFSSLASLNIVDKISKPLRHLKEMNRVAKRTEAEFLFSDPFSWSEEIAKKEDWLGGTSDGPYPGSGLDNILSLLKGKGGELLPPWRIEKKGHLWWKIRNHRNHFELIRSHFIKANR